ncbi:g2 mitotic-specific cyclin [Niveomyces insectorum RCEF 264]|uniref:G2 mitotic-specific cyclin n=1 Tax=Niveomyces insectorum RCEF 264 TaxID=1081102 RepID=A0A167X845_9HYPO|nr:g2 mitotic-specific cyclin [Niveomyces insectorum RCEF 264]
MDAKPPQRALRTLATIGQSNNENMAPTIFTANHLRHRSTVGPIYKDTVPVGAKVPLKRTAFGDVSNVVRPLVDAAAFAFSGKPNAIQVAAATAYPPPAPSTAPGHENAVPAANTGLFAPAQRPRNSVAVVPLTTGSEVSFCSCNGSQRGSSALPPSSQANDKRESLAVPCSSENSHAGAAARKSTVAFEEVAQSYAPAVLRSDMATSVDDLVKPEVSNSQWNNLKKSPRHYKSQPCLKNADYLPQQPQKPLRRTLSRLPVDRQTFKEVVVLADENADSAHATNKTNEPVDATTDAHNNPRFVDAVENVPHASALPPSSDATDVDISQIGEEVDAVPCAAEAPTNYVPGESARYVPPAGEATGDYLTDVSAALPNGAASEAAEEPWDEDADFYDDPGYTTAHSFRSLGDNTTGGLTAIVMPKMTAKVQNELDIARAIVESTIKPEDIEDEAWDISMVAEYGEEIYSYMRDLEAKMLPNPHYMDMQTEIQWSMRAVLMEWLIQVHGRFNLLPETLFLTVNYIDRFLSSKIVSVAKLQLVGATAIFIAAKYEEIICPSIQEIVYMVDGGYSTDEILKAERFMLSMLNFELGWPGPMSFLRRISKADEYDLDTRTLAKYLLEVTIMDERFVACPPSFLAAGAHCLARLLLYKGDWTTAHTHYSGYTWSQVRPLANMILHCCRDPRAHHAAVYEKYTSSKFKKASIYVEEELRRGFMMPPQKMHHSRHRPSLTDSLSTNSIDSGAPLRSNSLNMLIHTEG